MADRKLKFIGRSASTESTEYSTTMGRSVRRKKAKPKERWLLTRKTWRYMADAGRKLIPDGVQNRPEDVPRIEAYFQEICKRETKFLLWRKNSYPGAIGFRSKKHASRKAASCRKALSVDEVSLGRPERPTFLDIEHPSTGKFDVRKMKEDFLNKDGATTGFSSYDRKMGSTEQLNTDVEEKQLINMLEQYLRLAERDPNKYKADFNYQDLVRKLQSHLNVSSRNYIPIPTDYMPHQHVHFQGDHSQRSTLDTLSRYYAQSGNRDKIISDLLTDRKALEKLYFELRKTKGFRGSRGGTGYTTNFAYGPQRSNYENTNPNRLFKDQSIHEPPLIEVQGETSDVITYHNWATQTMPIPESVLLKIDEEYRKMQEEKCEEEPKEHKTVRRRSSVENDDVSQSVSDTIKRYLRMARKKSVDVDKADRFKRVNYDRNLRNIKAKGEITKPGDDDGLNKGCQTNEDWILTYRSLKFADMYDVSDVESRFSSSRSSIDIGIADEGLKSPPLSPPAKSHSFFSHLLHGKHDKHDKSDKSSSAVPNAANMQKSKSSSSVMHHGGRLMAKKIFRSRSKSQTRPAQAPCKWTPQGSCKWTNVTGRQVILSDTSLLHLTDVERKVLQKVAIAKLQALNLGVAVKVPSENVAGSTAKPKRRPYLLKKKALTTGIFDANRKENDKEKDRNSPSGGMVFGIPLTQCVENDRLNRAAIATSPFRSRSELVGGTAEESPTTIGRHGSRASFSSLIDAPRGDEKGSCENLMLQSRMVGSVPGLLDSISCSSAADIPVHTMEEESSVPNILSECFRHLESHGLHTLGIFRVSTSKKRIRQLREDFDCGKETTLEDDQCPHDVATLLKEYLRDLPDPLLCRELYHAFVHTQKIRNRKLQLEALQHLVQLLPLANRDTLYALLSFLSLVSRYSDDSTGALGELITGNKMDSNNLATVFAPNILHCIKPGAKDGDKPEDRIDIITVVRTLIDQYKTIFNVSAELLDEVYVHMMDSYPELLDQLLNKRDASATAAEESVDDLDSESNSAQWSPVALTADQSIDGAYDGKFAYEQKRTYSREEFLHESAATGGPNVGMRIRHKDRIRERSTRKKREKNEDASRTSSTLGIISRLRGQKDDDIHYTKNRSSSLESNSSVHMDSDTTRTLRSIDNLNERRKSSPYILDNNGVIKASLTIPVHTPNQPSPYNISEDIPYIEDGESGRQQFTIGVIKSPTAPPRRRNHSIGSDSSITSSLQPITGSISVVPGYDSAVGSSVTYSSSMQHNTPSSVSSSIADAGVYSSPPSWASSPPTSPDSTHVSVNFIPDDVQSPRPLSRAPKSVNIAKDAAPTLQKVSFSSTQEVQQIKDVSKSHHKLKHSNSSDPSRTASDHIKVEKEPRFTASITNIGNDVMKSKKAEFERIIKVDTGKTKNTSTGTSSSDREKKKYTKRRYTDSRHQTRHIPDAETVDSVASQCKQEEKTNVSQSGPVYKRRELISSAPSK